MRLLKEKYRNDPIVPKPTKGISAPKCLKYFYICLRTVVGKRGIPFYYVVRELEAVSNPAPPLINGEPYSEDNGRLENDLIIRALHVHSLFKQDAADVFQ